MKPSKLTKHFELYEKLKKEKWDISLSFTNGLPDTITAKRQDKLWLDVVDITLTRNTKSSAKVSWTMISKYFNTNSNNTFVTQKTVFDNSDSMLIAELTEVLWKRRSFERMVNKNG